MRVVAADIFIDELSRLGMPWSLPADWIICTDSDYLRDFPTMVERRKYLKAAKAEFTRRIIQERIDEIAEAWDSEDLIMVKVLMEAFPDDLEAYKEILSISQRQKWIDKASLAASGRQNECEEDQSLVYFVTDQKRVKIGFTTNFKSRLRSLRTSSPNDLQVLLVIAGGREEERKLHRRFAHLRERGEWFRRSSEIDEFVSSNLSDKASLRV